jgi:hypothetical protein
MTDKCHGLLITLKHDLMALGIEGVCDHSILRQLLIPRLAANLQVD